MSEYEETAKSALKDEILMQEGSNNDPNFSVFGEDYERVKYLSEGTERKNPHINNIEENIFSLLTPPVATTNLNETDIKIMELRAENVIMRGLMNVGSEDYTWDAQSHIENRKMEFQLNLRKSKEGWNRELFQTSTRQVNIGQQAKAGRGFIQRLKDGASR
tara:strand:+ start:7067 stop:7549 length:483 start_codon:yes stop_codon:yes gene_type:complete